MRAAHATRRRVGQDWARRYPPLMGGAVAMLMAIFALPSALQVPQTNPTQTLEFAPVPPQDDSPPPPAGGDLGSLSLGSSTGPATAGSAGAGGGPGSGLPAATPPGLDAGLPTDGMPPGAGSRPRTKQCVGNPPRQTEDPLSPPCVAHFEGDNGGRTYRGVTGNEIRVVLYVNGYPDSGDEYECGLFWDLSKPDGDFGLERAYARYFNDRYQTYGRSVHFYVQVSSCNDTPEGRRADAAEAIERVDPFAAFPIDPLQANIRSYLESLASQGVLAFLTPEVTNQPADYYRRYPGLLWGYDPTLDHQAALYAEYVCRQVVRHRVSFSGNVADQGQRRVLGQLYAADKDVPEAQYVSRRIAAAVRDCGGEIAVTRTTSKVDPDETDPASSREAATNMAVFANAGVTTILWTGLSDIQHSKAAAGISYRPEWVVLGSFGMDNNFVASLQDQSVWRHAWVITQAWYLEDIDDEPCYRAVAETDPTALPQRKADMKGFCLRMYIPLRQLFIGIQVAGPRLTPESMDQGFHAIPRIESKDPSVPACFYEPGDYTCVKDAVAQWWDPQGPAKDQYPANQPGCWRIPRPPRRHLLGTWPNHNVDARRQPDDLCNSYL